MSCPKQADSEQGLRGAADCFMNEGGKKSFTNCISEKAYPSMEAKDGTSTDDGYGDILLANQASR